MDPFTGKTVFESVAFTKYNVLYFLSYGNCIIFSKIFCTLSRHVMTMSGEFSFTMVSSARYIAVFLADMEIHYRPEAPTHQPTPRLTGPNDDEKRVFVCVFFFLGVLFIVLTEIGHDFVTAASKLERQTRCPAANQLKRQSQARRPDAAVGG